MRWNSAFYPTDYGLYLVFYAYIFAMCVLRHPVLNVPIFIIECLFVFRVLFALLYPSKRVRLCIHKAKGNPTPILLCRQSNAMFAHVFSTAAKLVSATVCSRMTMCVCACVCVCFSWSVVLLLRYVSSKAKSLAYTE